MTYLIDTHVLLWALENNPRLSEKARSILTDVENEIQLSVVSFWEIAIKLSINKLDLGYSFDRILSEVEKLGITILPISIEALNLLRTLPFNHRDPFDRLIISEGRSSGIPIISSDPKFHMYEIEVIW